MTPRQLSPSTYTMHGFTLLELLVAIAITLIIIPAMYASIDALYTSHASTIARALALTEASKGLETIVGDIRSASYADDGSLPLVAIATSSLTLYTDTDLDGRVERVRYFLSGDSLQKGVIEPTSTSSYPLGTETVSTLSSHIINAASSTPVFRYYSATSTEITTSAGTLDVRRVDVLLRAQSTFRHKVATVELESSASIRNLKDAY
jgi:prepilin-type N-terminal cleavage/methylation domain-containing protein